MTSEFSDVLLIVALVVYAVSTFAYFAAAERASAPATAATGRLPWPAIANLTLALGVATHVAHMVTRSLAAGRLPLGNMFEFSAFIALTTVIGGWVVVQRRMQRPELMGFVLLGALVTLAIAVGQLHTVAAPLQPILETHWRTVHVTSIAVAFGLFTLGVVFNALQLLRDTAERRVAESAGAGFGDSTVGAAQVDADADVDHDQVLDSVPSRVEADVDVTDEVDHDAEYRTALRASLAQTWLGVTLPWRIALGSAGVGALTSLMFLTYGEQAVLASNARVVVTMAVGMFVLTIIAWRAVGLLPTSSRLDSLTYRIVAVAFPIWTFAVITGAMWAEQSWGRYWGWDPKETSAFLTWVAYAAYLHARATRGMNGRRASILGLVSYGVLLFTYYAVNLLISGLHSYADVGA